jgi:hypothetical protein
MVLIIEPGFHTLSTELFDYRPDYFLLTLSLLAFIQDLPSRCGTEPPSGTPTDTRVYI